jgi:hypothetical protein
MLRLRKARAAANNAASLCLLLGLALSLPPSSQYPFDPAYGTERATQDFLSAPPIHGRRRQRWCLRHAAFGYAASMPFAAAQTSGRKPCSAVFAAAAAVALPCRCRGRGRAPSVKYRPRFGVPSGPQTKLPSGTGSSPLLSPLPRLPFVTSLSATLSLIE